jgi:colicin import membrane protein
MWPEVREHPSAFWAAVVLHVVALLLLLLSFRWSPTHTASAPAFTPPDIVEAVAIDARSFDAAQRARETERQAERAAVLAEQRRREEAARRAEAEQQRKAEEQRRAADEAKRREAEAKRQAELERQRALEEQRKREAAERRRQEELAAEQALMEKRLAEEEAAIRAAREAEAKRQAELERQRRAAEEQVRQAAAQRELSRLKADYASRIRSAVESSWEKPPGDWSGYTCVVFVRQSQSGIVLSVKVERCSGGGEVYSRSVENAVLRAEPLPAPPKPEAFEPEIRFTFRTPER